MQSLVWLPDELPFRCAILHTLDKVRWPFLHKLTRVQTDDLSDRTGYFTRLEAIALRLEAITLRLEAIATRVEAIALRLEAITLRLEAIATRVEAIALRLEAIATLRLEAIALRLEGGGHRYS